jgi:hypothetical protein
VNLTKSAVAKPEDRHFVGFRLRREPLDGSVEVLLSKRSYERIKTRIRELTPRKWGQSLDSCIDRLNSYLSGWIGFFALCTEAESRTLGNLDAHIRRRLRAIMLRHWKRKRTIAKRLIRKFGVRAHTAWKYIYRGNSKLWALSSCPAVNSGIRKACFAKRGLVSLLKRWRELHPKTIIVAPEQRELPLG